ncbi:unnamed protein product [Paramecium pentaurelia]|uniref:Uncharacterized protein n=1 Tax=Paramecium pentaurelia TaxID=43138 RepID=A0A8S1WQX4_9CILI|nr:unnamed protein product [Paramecium pentaurelia]
MISDFIKDYPKLQILLYILGLFGLLKCTKVLYLILKLMLPSTNLTKYGNRSQEHQMKQENNQQQNFHTRDLKLFQLQRTFSKLDRVA